MKSKQALEGVEWTESCISPMCRKQLTYDNLSCNFACLCICLYTCSYPGKSNDAILAVGLSAARPGLPPPCPCPSSCRPRRSRASWSRRVGALATIRRTSKSSLLSSLPSAASIPSLNLFPSFVRPLLHTPTTGRLNGSCSYRNGYPPAEDSLAAVAERHQRSAVAA